MKPVEALRRATQLWDRLGQLEVKLETTKQQRDAVEQELWVVVNELPVYMLPRHIAEWAGKEIPEEETEEETIV